MKLSRLVLPALMLAVVPVINMIATASSASGGPPRASLAWMSGVGIEPAQFNVGPGTGPHGGGRPGPGGPGPGGFGPGKGRPPGFQPGPFGMGGPDGMPPSPRAFCEGRIHREAGIRAQLRSRLKLDPGQREAWAKMEALVEPVDLRSRELCMTLPAEAAGPPAAPEKLAFAEQQLGLRLETLKLLQAPFRDFYQTLSADQRTVLDRPMRP